MRDFGTPNFRRIGETAITVDCAVGNSIQAQLWAFARSVRARPNVCEAVVGAGNCTVLFARDAFDARAAIDELKRVWNGVRADEASARTFEIPVTYDGEDLAEVARSCGLREDEVAALHAGAECTVAFVGFQPGFAYIDGLDARLHLPRRAEPRTRVPAGAVAIAGAQSAVYPFASPGGWHIIGTTQLRMFDPQREPAALLQPGDRVRFVSV
jgi:5-oxoprolinase (ATP-hydrolysing) subunit B